MSDNISRQEAIDALWKLRRSLQMMDNSQEADIVMRGVFLAEKKIEALPSTDRNGRWLEANGKPAEGLHDVYCSECGEMSEYRSSFCPDCGADMRGEGDGR